jgi:DNA-binding XRE family transcriptional regulator
VGIPVDGVRKIASGRTRPTLVTALRIADALQVEVEDMFGRDDVD